MREYSNLLLRIVCGALAVLVLYEVVQMGKRWKPLGNTRVPVLPVLAMESTNTTKETTKPSTNAPSTNAPSTVSRPNPRPGQPVKVVDLPPTIRPRVDRITQSEILAPFKRPLPSALLGIGGREALLRAASGQTGNLKEGEEMGGLKLLRIGTNRVLVLENNQTNELMIFSGFGGPTLLPKTNTNSP